MEKSDSSPIVYDKSVIDFVTVAVEFCAFLENEEPLPRAEWIDRMLKMLPLLYVKASLLPEIPPTDQEPPAAFVREEDYSRVATRIAEVMGEEDTYLDVFVDDMKYSDQPVAAFVSENIADLYQDIRNFVSVYQLELTGQMQDALCICRENFFLYWGQKLVNVMRPLHALKCSEAENETGAGMEDLNGEALWD